MTNNTQTHVTFTCAACHDTFTMPRDGSCGTGYAIERLVDETGTYERKYCYPCAARNERAQARKTGELLAYVKGVTITQSRNYRKRVGRIVNDPHLATWPGIRLAHISAGDAYRSNFGDVRVPITFTLDGELWHGTYFASAGDYAICKRNKIQTAGGN